MLQHRSKLSAGGAADSNRQHAIVARPGSFPVGSRGSLEQHAVQQRKSRRINLPPTRFCPPPSSTSLLFRSKSRFISPSNENERNETSLSSHFYSLSRRVELPSCFPLPASAYRIVFLKRWCIPESSNEQSHKPVADQLAPSWKAILFAGSDRRPSKYPSGIPFTVSV